MEIQREKARESWKGSGEEAVSILYQKLPGQGISTVFVGYEGVCEAESKVTALLNRDGLAEELGEGEEGEVIVAETPFYGEIGGQIGDTGTIEGKDFVFDVLDTRRPLDNLISHVGRVRTGRIRKGDSVNLIVAEEKRRATEANHSGTHVLQAAMKRVLGDHIKQSGSLVTAERLRFDFTHFSRIEDDELERIENLANAVIRRNMPVVTQVLPIEKALKTGATAVFDEKYGDRVRVVQMGDFSMELCGGTHIRRTGDIGFLKILHESAVAAGVRRIEAVTGGEAVKYARRVENELKKAAHLLKANPSELSERVEKLVKNQKEMEKELDTFKSRLAAKDSADLLGQAKEVKGIKVLTAAVNAPDAKTLRDFGDKLRDRLQSGIILIGCRAEGKAMLLCLVTKDLTDRYSAGNIIREIAPIVGGRGGGRPDMAQAGGPNPENLEQALKRLEELI